MLGTPEKEGIMLDLETLSTKSNAAIIAIGAVKFKLDGEIGEKFYQRVDAQSSEDAGLHISASTVMWWLQQSPQAQKALFVNPVPLRHALLSFHEFYGEDSSIPLWGNGANFDNVVLGNAYQACGLKAPWSFRANRCYRTIRNLYTGVLPKMEGVAHDALADAVYQAECLQIMLGLKG